MAPKGGKSTDQDHYLISSESGQDTSACKTSGHFLHAFSAKCPETSPDGGTDGRTCCKTVTVGRMDQRTHVQMVFRASDGRYRKLSKSKPTEYSFIFVFSIVPVNGLKLSDARTFSGTFQLTYILYDRYYFMVLFPVYFLLLRIFLYVCVCACFMSSRTKALFELMVLLIQLILNKIYFSLPNSEAIYHNGRDSAINKIQTRSRKRMGPALEVLTALSNSPSLFHSTLWQYDCLLKWDSLVIVSLCMASPQPGVDYSAHSGATISTQVLGNCRLIWHDGTMTWLSNLMISYNVSRKNLMKNYSICR